MKFLPYLLFASLLAVIAQPANATPIPLEERDYFSAGDGLITYDPNTGLEWLDWTETVSLSYNDVVGQLGSGGAFEGWNYATSAGVLELFNNALIPYADAGDHAENYVPVVQLVALLGTTYEQTGTPANSAAYAITGDSIVDNQADVARLWANHDIQTGNANPEYATYPYHQSYSTTGHALVREGQDVPHQEENPAVPEPSTIALLAMGLIGLAGSRIARRKTQ